MMNGFFLANTSSLVVFPIFWGLLKPSKTGGHASNLPMNLSKILSIYNLHIVTYDIPSGKLSQNYGKSQFLRGKSTTSMTIFYVAGLARCLVVQDWLKTKITRGLKPPVTGVPTL